MTRALRRHHLHRVAAKRRPLERRFRPGHERSDNELAKRDPADCGKRCLLCHMDKLLRSGSRRAEWKRDVQRQLAEW